MMTKLLWKGNWDEISTQGRHTDVVVKVCLSCINYKTSYYNLYKSILLALMLTLVFEEDPLSDMITQMSMLCMKPRSSPFRHDHPNVDVVYEAQKFRFPTWSPKCRGCAWSPEVPLSNMITQMSRLCMKPGSSPFRHDHPNVDVVYEAQKFPFPTWSPNCRGCAWSPEVPPFRHDHPNVDVVYETRKFLFPTWSPKCRCCVWRPEVPLSNIITQMSMLCMKPGSSPFRHNHPNVYVVYEARKFPFPAWSPKCQCCVWNPDQNRERTEWVIIAPVWQQ